MAKTSFTSVGSSADAPQPLLRPSPATGHDAEKLEVYDPDLGYNAENFPYKPLQRGMRPTISRRALERLWGNISIYSIVGRQRRGKNSKTRSYHFAGKESNDA
jgi:hypothetical protein